MATYYARNVTGNWAANTSWDAASSGGAGPAGPPVAGDTAIFDSGFTGNISVAATAACAIVTVQAGATGTLTFTAGQTLTASGNVTFVSGFNLAGTGTLRMSGAATLTSGGLTIPGQLTSLISGTLTLADALTVTGTLSFGGSTTLSGAFNITCGTLNCSTPATIQFVSGQTLTVTTAITIAQGQFAATTLRSVTASSSTALTYQGTAANCKIAGAIFTDIDASGSAQAILNWYGGTLTRTTNIYNATFADFPAVTAVQSGVGYGGTDASSANRLTGTLSGGGGGHIIGG